MGAVAVRVKDLGIQMHEPGRGMKMGRAARETKRMTVRRGLVAVTMVATSAVTLAATPTASSATTQVDQCAQPLRERVGGWSCAASTVPSETQRRADLQQLAKVGELTAPQAATAPGFCSFDGCWSRVSAVRSTFIGQGSYGYGKQALGTSHLSFTVTTSGFATVSKPLFGYTTRSTRNTVLHAERLYLSAGFLGGNAVSGGATRRTSPCGPRHGSQSCTWAGVGGAGFGSFENTAKHISIVHEISWTDPTFPGRWHSYAKSVIMNWSRLGYQVDARAAVPARRAAGGWSPT